MKNRIEYIIPEAPDEYEAYLYLWHLWIEELNCWKFYGGRKHARYHKVDYLHSSEDKQFKNDFARSKRVIFELLKYGENEEMALEEGTLLKQQTMVLVRPPQHFGITKQMAVVCMVRGRYLP